MDNGIMDTVTVYLIGLYQQQNVQFIQDVFYAMHNALFEKKNWFIKYVKDFWLTKNFISKSVIEMKKKMVSVYQWKEITFPFG